jgi:spore coat-associated protein N
MSRITKLASRPKRTLGALAVVLAAVGITVGSGANFTASKANAGNVFTTGSLTIGDSVNGAILTMDKMVPGDSVSGTADISNTGNVAGTFALASSLTGNAPLANALRLGIIDCGIVDATHNPDCVSGTTPVYSTGALDGFFSTSLGQFAAGDTHRYKFTASLPGSVTDNTLQGKTATATFTWSAQTL